MFKACMEILKELLDLECDLVNSYRVEGIPLIKPTSIIAMITSFLYLASPIDIVPECLLGTFRFIGYLDDLLILVLSSAYFYNTIKEVVLKDEQDCIPSAGVVGDTSSDGQVEVPIADRPDVQHTDGDNSADSVNTNLREEPEVDICSIIDGAVNFANSNGDGDTESDEDDEYPSNPINTKLRSKFR